MSACETVSPSLLVDLHLGGKRGRDEESGGGSPEFSLHYKRHRHLVAPSPRQAALAHLCGLFPTMAQQARRPGPQRLQSGEALCTGAVCF